MFRLEILIQSGLFTNAPNSKTPQYHAINFAMHFTSITWHHLAKSGMSLLILNFQNNITQGQMNYSMLAQLNYVVE